MRTRAFLVGIVAAGLLTLMSMSGGAEIAFVWFTDEGKLRRATISALEVYLLEVEVDIMMNLPDEYPAVDLEYDEAGTTGRSYELMYSGVKLDTRGKIVIDVRDTRGWFSSITSEAEFLEKFKRIVALVTYELHFMVTNDVDNDVVVFLIAKEGTKERGLLGYFYEGEYVVGPFFLTELYK